MAPNEPRGAPRPGTPRHDQHPAKDTDSRSRATVAHGVLPLVPVALAVRVAAEANRIDAERRDRECRCPGRAYVSHAWDLGSHKDGCSAGYAWLSADEARAVLQALPRRKLAALSLAIGGTL